MNTLLLNGSTGTTEDLGGYRGKPCRGVLQLPVHKFGILGYPYSNDELQTKNPETPTSTIPPRYELPKVPEGYFMSE